MKIVRATQTIYLKDTEKEELELIANIRNIERAGQSKKSLGISSYIHLLLQQGINAELKRLNLPKDGIMPNEPNELLETYENLLKND